MFLKNGLGLVASPGDCKMQAQSFLEKWNFNSVLKKILKDKVPRKIQCQKLQNIQGYKALWERASRKNGYQNQISKALDIRIFIRYRTQDDNVYMFKEIREASRYKQIIRYCKNVLVDLKKNHMEHLEIKICLLNKWKSLNGWLWIG